MATTKKEQNMLTVSNVETGETFLIPITEEELAIVEAENIRVKNEKETFENARLSARAKLAELGLTEEEIAAL